MLCPSSAAPAIAGIYGSIDNSTYNRATVSDIHFLCSILQEINSLWEQVCTLGLPMHALDNRSSLCSVNQAYAKGKQLVYYTAVSYTAVEKIMYMLT